MTLVTTISVATPRAMPTSEKTAMIGDEALAPARAQVAAGDRAFEGSEHAEFRLIACQRLLAASSSLPLAGRAALQLHLAGGRAARTDDDLPGMAHQVGIGELRPCPLVAVVVQRRRRRASRTAPRTSHRTPHRRACRLRIAALNGAMLSGQMMPASSWLASITAPTRRETPMP